MTLTELYRELQRHDWFHEMSDDHRVWSAGQQDKQRLIRESMKVEGGQKLMADFSKHVFSGEAFGTPKAPKPEPPVESVSCELCGAATPMTGTKRCHRCWELERRVKADPELAGKILAQLEAGNTVV